MPTDEKLNADVNADDSAHSTTDSEEDNFDARQAFDKANERHKRETQELKEELGEVKELLKKGEETQEDEDKQDDVQSDDIDKKIADQVEKATWLSENKSRIELLPDEASDIFKDRQKRGYEYEDALRIAEQSAGIVADSRVEDKVQNATASGGSIDRGDNEDDISPEESEDMKKFGYSKESLLKQKQLKRDRGQM